MNKNDVNYPRFLRALKCSLDGLTAEAKLLGQVDDPDYLEIKKHLEEQIERLQEG